MRFDIEIYFCVYGLKAKAINYILEEFEDEAPIENVNIDEL